MTSGVVDFSYPDWAGAFPQLASTVTEQQAGFLFRTACTILNNTPFSIVQNVDERRDLLWLLVAHQAQLGLNATAGNGSSTGAQPVGRLASATRGSVSVSYDGSGLSSNAGWFNQTQYGLLYWQATAQYRQMRLSPGRPHPARIWP